MRTLKLVKNVASNFKPPSIGALEKLISLCDNPEIAGYTYNALKKTYDTTPNPEIYSDVLANVKKLWDLISQKAEAALSIMPWRASKTDAPIEPIEMSIRNDISGAASSAEGAISQAEGAVEESAMGVSAVALAAELGESRSLLYKFAIDQSSKLLQGVFNRDGMRLEGLIEEALDNLYAEWLVSNRMYAHDGVVYHQTDEEKGESKAVEPEGPEGYRALFLGKAVDSKGQKIEGFAEFVANKTNNLLSLDVEDVSDGFSDESSPAQKR